MQLCRFLRWKGYEVRVGFTPEEVERVLEMNAVPYECLLTAFPWGPDDEPCAPECCTRERPCFEALWAREPTS